MNIDALLKIDTNGNASFATIAGLRCKSLLAGGVDFLAAEAKKALGDKTGIKHASISGSGVFRDAAADATVRQLFFDGTIRDWQVIVPDFGTLQGAFQVTTLEYSGEHNGEVAYELALESVGAVAFTKA